MNHRTLQFPGVSGSLAGYQVKQMPTRMTASRDLDVREWLSQLSHHRYSTGMRYLSQYVRQVTPQRSMGYRLTEQIALRKSRRAIDHEEQSNNKV